MHSRIWLAIAGLVLVAVLARPVVADVADEVFARTPCPDRPLAAKPNVFQLHPSLIEHQNWVEVEVPQADATDFELCVDGRLLGQEVGHTPVDGRVRVSVPTRWVNIRWLTGQLDHYRSPAHWDVRYTTYALERAARNT